MSWAYPSPRSAALLNHAAEVEALLAAPVDAYPSEVAPCYPVDAVPAAPSGGGAVPGVGAVGILLGPDAVHVASAEVVHAERRTGFREGSVELERGSVVPLDTGAVLVAVAQADGGGCVSRIDQRLQHLDALGAVACGAGAVEDAQGLAACRLRVSRHGGLGVQCVGACRVEVGADCQLGEPAEHVFRVGVLVGCLSLEVFVY